MGNKPGKRGPYKTRIGIVEIEKIKERYKEGVAYNKIAEELGCTEYTVQQHVKTLKELGVLGKRKVIRDNFRRTKSLETIEKEKRTEEKKAAKAERANAPKIGTWCDLKTSKKCMYGNQSEMRLDGPKCNYALMTGKCRTVQNGESGFNDPHHCMCFEPKVGKRDSTMPLRKIIDEEAKLGRSKKSANQQ